MSNILLVASDSDEAALASATLAGAGVRVIEAELYDGLDAILLRERVQLLVLVEQLREDTLIDWVIGALDRYPLLPMIVVCDSDRLDRRRVLLDSDPRMLLLPKPLDPSQLTFHVTQLLGEQAAAETRDEWFDAAPNGHPKQRLLELQRQMASELPGRFQRLAAKIGEARVSPEAANELLDMAHKLRGTASAYGFTAVSKAAGELEDVLSARRGAVLSRGELSRLEAALSDLVASAEAPPRALLEQLATRTYLGQAPLLVLEDDAALLRRLQSAARSQFLDVIVARHPHAALEHARRVELTGAIVGASFERNMPGLGQQLRAASQRVLPLAYSGSDLGALSGPGDTLSDAVLLSGAASDADLAEVLRRMALLQFECKQRVLVVDSDSAFGLHVESLLASHDVTVSRSPSADRLLEQLAQHEPDLLLLELGEPAVTLDLCQTVRRTLKWQSLPIMIVSPLARPGARFDAAEAGAELRVRAYRAGVSDFLARPILAEELLARAGVHLAQARLLKARAETDLLTGLFNVRPFMEAAERAMSRARRAVDPVSLALIDLDRLTALNAEHGDTLGDKVIQNLGRLMRARFRTSDLRCRWGGGRFVVLFEGADKAAIQPSMQALLAELAGQRFVGVAGTTLTASFSAGVAGFPEDGESLHALLIRADLRLCQAKQAGGAQICRDELLNSPLVRPRAPFDPAQ